jgi:putative hydrolase of the HAD superfamily
MGTPTAKRSFQMKFKSAIFDLDDTLYDHKTLNALALQKVCDFVYSKTKISKEKFFDTFYQVRKETNLRLSNTAASHNRILYFQALAEKLSVYSSEFCLDLYNLYWDFFLGRMVLRDGVLEVFNLLRANKIKIAICSDLTTLIQHRKIKQLGINNFIDALITSEEAGSEKPDAAMFNLCIKKLKTKPQECFFVGDNFQRDIKGAIKAGMTAIYFDIGDGADIDMTKMFVRISTFAQLYDWTDKTKIALR